MIVEGKGGVNGDTVHHYGRGKEVDIRKVGTHSYHEHGVLDGNITLKDGRLVLEKGSVATSIRINTTAEDITNGQTAIYVENALNPNVPIIVEEDVKAAIDSKIGAVAFTNQEMVAEINDNSVATIGGTSYTSIENAVDAAKNGETVIMSRPILQSEQSNQNIIARYGNMKSITIDFNGFESYLEDCVFLQNIEVTLKNGTVHCGWSQINGSPTDVENWVHLTIAKDFVFDAPYGLYLSLRAPQTYYYGVIVDVYGTIESSTALFVQGNIGNDQTSSLALLNSGHLPKINFYDGCDINGELALNGMCMVNVYGGSFTSDEEFTFGVKRGTLNIFGGTINYEGDEYKDPETIEANDNGTETCNSAIAVTSTYNYAGAIAINVSGGTIRTKVGHALIAASTIYNSTVVEYEQGAVDLNITGGEFISGEGKAALYVRDTLEGGFITGGSFDTEPDDEWVASGHSKTNVNGTWIVA